MLNSNCYKIFAFIYFPRWEINPETTHREQFNPPCGFSKNVSFKERVKPWLFWTFNIIISHIFSEIFIEVPQVVQKIWRLALSILAIFIIFHQFFWLFNIFLLQRNQWRQIKLILDKSFLKYEVGQIDTPKKKLPSKLPALLGVRQILRRIIFTYYSKTRNMRENLLVIWKMV